MLHIFQCDEALGIRIFTDVVMAASDSTVRTEKHHNPIVESAKTGAGGRCRRRGEARVVTGGFLQHVQESSHTLSNELCKKVTGGQSKAWLLSKVKESTISNNIWIRDNTSSQ